MAAKVQASKEREPPNIVHQNAILCETIKKEQRSQKLYSNYGINPFKKIHVIAGKPNSNYDTEDGEEDSHFKSVISRAQQEPVKKYKFPQTEAQEIGWITKPLIEQDKTDCRLNFPRRSTAVTDYMSVAWKIKEQTENLN